MRRDTGRGDEPIANEVSLAILAVSISAFTVSLYSLWRTTLSPFNLRVSYDSPTFTIYRMTPTVSGGESVWWIPSIDMDFTFYNMGKRGGEVTDIRIVGRLKSDGTLKTYVFYARWVVDFKSFQQNRDDRIAWIESSVEKTWYPLLLSGDEERTSHIVFEGLRWDAPMAGELTLELEIFSSSEQEWRTLERFEHHVSEGMFRDTSAVQLTSSRIRKTREDISSQWST